MAAAADSDNELVISMAREELQNNLVNLLNDYNNFINGKPGGMTPGEMSVFLGSVSFLSGQLCAFGGKRWEELLGAGGAGSPPQKIATIGVGIINLNRAGVEVTAEGLAPKAAGRQDFPQLIDQFQVFNGDQDILDGFTNMAKAGWDYVQFIMKPGLKQQDIIDFAECERRERRARVAEEHADNTFKPFQEKTNPGRGTKRKMVKGGRRKKYNQFGGDGEEEEEEGALKGIMINMITTSIMLGMGVAAIKSGAAIVALRGIDYCYRLGKSMLFSLGYLKDPCTTDFQIIAGLIIKSMPGIGQHYQSCGDIARRNEAMTLALRGTMGTIYTAAVAMGLKTIGWNRAAAIVPTSFSIIKMNVAEPLYNNLASAGAASKDVTIRVFTKIAENGSQAAKNGANKILGLFRQASCGLNSGADDKRVADVAATVSAVTAAKDVTDAMDRMERGADGPTAEQQAVAQAEENRDEGNTSAERAAIAKDPTEEIQIMIDKIQDADTKAEIKAAVNTFILRTNADLALEKMNEEQSKIDNAETPPEDKETAKKAITNLYKSMDKNAKEALKEKELSVGLRTSLAGVIQAPEEESEDEGDASEDEQGEDAEGGGRRKNKRRPRKTKKHMRKKKKTRRRKTKGRKNKTRGKGKSKSGTIKRKPKSKTRKGKRKAKRSTRKYKR